MDEFLQVLFAMQRRQIQGVWQVQRIIEEVSNAVASNQQFDSGRIAALTAELGGIEGELKTALEAAGKV